MKKLLKLGLLLIGALALSFTMATAENKCAPAEKCAASGKCTSGKCGKGMKDAMKKELNTTKPSIEKKVPTKGKCGQGKCG